MASTLQPHQARVSSLSGCKTLTLVTSGQMRCLMSDTRSQDVCSFVSERLETERRLPGLGEMMDTPVRDGDSQEKHYKHYKYYKHYTDTG